eukprot:6198042-Pleurochrysis_carterae.AAC.1
MITARPEAYFTTSDMITHKPNFVNFQQRVKLTDQARTGATMTDPKTSSSAYASSMRSTKWCEIYVLGMKR